MALEGTYVHWLAVNIQPRYCCEGRTSSCCLCLTFVWYLFIDLQVNADHLLCSSPLIPTSQTFPRSNVKLISVDLAFKPTPPFTVSINKFPSPPFFLHAAPLSCPTPPSPSLHTGSACQEADEQPGCEAKLPVTCHLRGHADTRRHVLYSPFSLQP